MSTGIDYPDIFIQVAPDCPVAHGVVPESKRNPKPVHVIQFEVLSGNPYRYNYEELLFEVHLRRSGTSDPDPGDGDLQSLLQALRKKHPCLRTSALGKKYGWGIHGDGEGRLAIWGRDSEEYRRFTEAENGGPTLTTALRSKRA